MQIRRIKVSHAPILLIDSGMDSAVELGTHLELNGFPTRIEHTGAGALAAMKDTYFATLIVIADFNDSACFHRLDDLRRAASRSWMIVVSPRCDANTCELIYRHGGDACITAPVSINDLISRLSAFQLRSRTLY
jgi:DNA-binding response OmpR family regulator